MEIVRQGFSFDRNHLDQGTSGLPRAKHRPTPLLSGGTASFALKEPAEVAIRHTEILFHQRWEEDHFWLFKAIHFWGYDITNQSLPEISEREVNA